VLQCVCVCVHIHTARQCTHMIWHNLTVQEIYYIHRGSSASVECSEQIHNTSCHCIWVAAAIPICTVHASFAAAGGFNGSHGLDHKGTSALA
jgi:hypothetical protein